MWDLPRSGIEPVSPAFAGGFFTTGPPGKPLRYSGRTFISGINSKLVKREWPDGKPGFDETMTWDSSGLMNTTPRYRLEGRRLNHELETTEPSQPYW